MAIYQVDYTVNKQSKLGMIEIPEVKNEIELLREIKDALSYLENVAMVDIRKGYWR
ncbi:hypothetical protein ACFQZT_30810 [Paenibacillus sp. GCM10027628]|uniref:hypothetical protein n=1 Tax=Paenibacillus sp. GCM10027628 TaxID=3273413 RepID=UPI00362AD79E